jgi:GTP pyrophosphokinase
MIDRLERLRGEVQATSSDAALLKEVRRAEDVVAILQGITKDEDVELGTLLYPLLSAKVIDDTRAAADYGTDAARIARELTRLGNFAFGAFETSSLSDVQSEGLRKMLLAIVTDPRLVLVKLAYQLEVLRSVKSAPAAERQRVARETKEIYAPLANRLGVWQLKWELEDLSFRYLEPDHYKQIATLLAAKRVDRERYIADVIALIKSELAKAGVESEIVGRPKHIYSIWRKMQRKQLDFEQVYDIRAVRILVSSLADCYAALGLVHGLWPYIPGEFDDYIATPKDNLYQSLHTAVIGPGKLPLEIQIRTREMNEHAELGVAAHWQYKEGGKANAAYQRKINWLRQILEPTGEEAESDGDFLERVRSELFEDRVYALSPRGEVIDLPRGATPLDFAYQVHTNLGHRCRGAKVNGRMVPLTHQLGNGDQVEIVTGKEPAPSRDWLVPSLGYLASQRNRSKVRAWFRKQDEDVNRAQGRQMLERELQRLAVPSVTLDDLCTEFKQKDADALYLAIGEGDITLAQVSGAILRRMKPQDMPPIARRAPNAKKQVQGLTVDGVGDLLSNFARCCRPVPPEPIAGYITLGRGVSIHRQNCASLERLRTNNPERVIAVDWGTAADREFSVDIAIRAFDRRGLVRDVTGVVADSKINIQAMNTVTHAGDGVADLSLRILVRDLTALGAVLARIQSLPNIISVRRKT